MTFALLNTVFTTAPYRRARAAGVGKTIDLLS